MPGVLVYFMLQPQLIINCKFNLKQRFLDCQKKYVVNIQNYEGKGEVDVHHIILDSETCGS